jgi:hypothetical protein
MEIISCSASQEMPIILWHVKVHYCVHKSPPLVNILCQMNPVQIFPSRFFRIHLILTSHLSLSFSSGIFPCYKTFGCIYPLSHVLHTLPMSSLLTWSLHYYYCLARVQIMNSSLWNFLRTLITSSLYVRIFSSDNFCYFLSFKIILPCPKAHCNIS